MRGSGARVASCLDARERIICAYTAVRRAVHLRAGCRPRTGSNDERRWPAEGLVSARLTPGSVSRPPASAPRGARRPL